MTSPQVPDATPTRNDERGKVEVRFLPGCLVVSIVLSVVGTILVNLLLRLLG